MSLAFKRALRLLGVTACMSCVIATAQEITAIKAAAAWTGTGDRIEPAVVLVADGKIKAIGARLEVPQGARAIDLGKCTLTPGLVQGVSFAGLPRGNQENEESREVTPAFRAADAIDPDATAWRQWREAGVTSLAVHPGARNVIGGLICHAKAKARGEVVRDVIGLRVTLGPDAAFGNRGMRRGSPGMFQRIPLSRMGTVYLVRTALEQARGGKAGSDDAERAVLADVLSGKLRVFWQARGSKDMLAALNLIEEFGLKNNVLCECWEAHAFADKIKQHDAGVLLGPLIHRKYHWGGRRDEARWHVWTGPAQLAKAGVRAAFSGGTSSFDNGLSDMARFATRYGLDRATAVSWLTLEPARLLGIDKRVGSLEVGKDADLVAWSGDPLAPTSATELVMIDGNVAFQRNKASGEKQPVKETK